MVILYLLLYIEIYYYEIKSDVKPDLEKTKRTESEKKNNFELRYVPMDDVENEFITNAEKYGDEHAIAKEMLKRYNNGN